MPRICLVVLACVSSLTVGASFRSPRPPGLVFLAASDFDKGQAQDWRPNDRAHWRVVKEDGESVYELTAPGEQGKVRAPTSRSLWAGHDVTSFEFSGRMRCHTDSGNSKRDLCIFFHFQDPTHFYYVHFAGSSDDVHNIIALVNGADRVKVNIEPAGSSAARLIDKTWHEFKVLYDARSGAIEAYLDDMVRPILTARGSALGHGLVGVGSFDDTGSFVGLKLWGESKEVK